MSWWKFSGAARVSLGVDEDGEDVGEMQSAKVYLSLVCVCKGFDFSYVLQKRHDLLLSVNHGFVMWARV